jgi:hypothetical protein
MALRRIIVVLAIGAILMGLASTTFVWAAPGQSPVRQTLPTRHQSLLRLKRKDKPTPVPTLTTPTLTRTGWRPSEQLKPAAAKHFPRSQFFDLLAGAIVFGMWLVYIGWVRNRARDKTAHRDSDSIHAPPAWRRHRLYVGFACADADGC